MAGHVSPKSTYAAIFAALMALTILTIALAYVDIGVLHFPATLGIAILKGTLVVLFFMHVKYSSQLTKLIVSAAFFFLLILFGLTLTDYMSRGWQTFPAASVEAEAVVE